MSKFPEFPMNALLERMMKHTIHCRGCNKELEVKMTESLANHELLKVLEIYKVWIKRMGRGLITVRELAQEKGQFDVDAKHMLDMVNKIVDKIYLESEIRDVLDDGTKLSCEEDDKSE